jgi:hypothetical protein
VLTTSLDFTDRSRRSRKFRGLKRLLFRYQDTRVLEKQNWLQMSQVFFCIRTLIIRLFCFSRILSEAASPIDAAPNATLRSLHLAGLRRGLARNSQKQHQRTCCDAKEKSSRQESESSTSDMCAQAPGDCAKSHRSLR